MKYLVSLDFAKFLAGDIRLDDHFESMVWEFCNSIGCSDFTVEYPEITPITQCAVLAANDISEMAYCAVIVPA